MQKPLIPATKAWDHQERALDFIADKAGAMLAMEMGCGKTYVAIQDILRTGAKRILVIAPLSVVDHVWEDQILRHADGTLDYILLGQHHTSTKRKIEKAKIAWAKTPLDHPLLVIANYETTIRPEFKKWATSQQWDMLILDESHRAKAPTGVTADWLAKLARNIPRRLALTGTPMPHSPMDIFAQYRIIEPAVFGESYHRFRDRYAVIANPPKNPKPGTPRQAHENHIVNFKNRDELAELFHTIAFEVRSDDVLELPPVNRLSYRVSLKPQTMTLYQDLNHSLKATLESGQTINSPNVLAQLTRLQQLTSGFAATRGRSPIKVDDAKADAVKDILTNLPIDEPVVVFARFLHDIETVREVAESTGRKAWELTGQQKQLSEWNAEGGVLTAQTQAGGTGLDLTNARYCIYYSLGYNLGEFLQSQARLHRPGQQHTVHQIHLIAAHTIDQKVMQSLIAKEDVIEAIITSHQPQVLAAA